MVKFYPATMIYASLILISVIVIMSSGNWFFIWLGLELSMFGFLPLFSSTSSTTEAITKYFLVQTSGSAMYLMSFLLSVPDSSFLLIMGMSMKIGLLPFLQWVPAVMISLSWGICLVLTTIQKLGPLIILMMVEHSPVVVSISCLTITISSLLGFNQSLLRKLMAYSSISHSSWILLASLYSLKLCLIYISLYFFTTAILFNSFKESGMDWVSQPSDSEKDLMDQKVCMLVLMGIPPFSIFFMKAFIFSAMIDMPFMVGIILVSTYLSSYYYLSFILPNLLMKSLKMTFNSAAVILLNLIMVVLLL